MSLGAGLGSMPTTSFAQNLVQNPSFETATGCSGPQCSASPPWTYTGAAFTADRDPTAAHSGNNYLLLAFPSVASGPNGPGPTGTASQSVTVTRPGLYTFSFWENTAFFAPGTFSLTASAGATTTFNANVSNTSYVEQSATVNLSAGTNAIQFSGTSLSGNPAASELMIDDVSLLLLSASALSPLLPPGAPANAVNVAAAIDSTSGALPTGFENVNLFNLSGPSLVNALEQLDGENATGAERGAFDLMNEFLGLMLDPFVYGRGGFATGGQPLGFAPDQQTSLPPDIALAYAGVAQGAAAANLRAALDRVGARASAAAPRPTAIRLSDQITSRRAPTAMRPAWIITTRPTRCSASRSPAAAPIGISRKALGTGRSDAFLAGVYGVTHEGPAYLAAALAFANNWFTTNRTALGDQLTASFQGQSYSARLEGGYRFAVPVYHGPSGVTPYAASRRKTSTRRPTARPI